jgi:hypothetical protein
MGAEPMSDCLPHRVLVREAVQQDDDRRLRRSLVDHVEHQLAPMELFHWPTVSPEDASLR